MAALSAEEGSVGEPTSAAKTSTEVPTRSLSLRKHQQSSSPAKDGPSPSENVEMSNLSPHNAPASSIPEPQQPSEPPPASTATPPQPGQEQRSATSQQPQSTTMATETPAAVDTSALRPSPPNALNRTETEAIGPSTDDPISKPDPASGPAVLITLLLISGARHPYRVDEKYLRRRDVKPEDMNPYNISVYTLKELIWRDWREEWEPRPTSPSAIRLIHFGRLLDDKDPLSACRFRPEVANVVHMTVKPQDTVDEEADNTGKGSKGSHRDRDEDRSPGCRCIIL